MKILKKCIKFSRKSQGYLYFFIDINKFNIKEFHHIRSNIYKQQKPSTNLFYGTTILEYVLELHEVFFIIIIL